MHAIGFPRDMQKGRITRMRPKSVLGDLAALKRIERMHARLRSIDPK